MRPTHHHWSCPACGNPERIAIATPWLFCPECNASMDYDADAEYAEYDALMREVGAGPECTTAG